MNAPVTLQEYIIQAITKTLRRNGNNKTHAALTLQCSDRYVRLMVRRHEALAEFRIEHDNTPKRKKR